MDILWWILIAIAVMVWIAIAFWPARVAGRKGHSFIGFFVFSLFFFPAALIVAYLVHDHSPLPPRAAVVHLAARAASPASRPGDRHHVGGGGWPMPRAPARFSTAADLGV